MGPRVSRVILSAAASLAAALAACSGTDWQDADADYSADDEQLELGSLEQAITGGTEITNSDFASVVKFNAAVGSCTATKIGQTAPNGSFPNGTSKFLTAAHCTSSTTTQVRITNLNNPPDNGTLFSVVANQTGRHPSFLFRGEPENSTADSLYDVAVVTISNATTSIPTATLGGAATVANGVNLTGVGYGCNTSNPAIAGRKQKATFTTATPSAVQNGAHSIFDTGNPSGCDGDSGGPLFNSSNQIVGSLRGGDGTITTWPRTGNVLDWINNPKAANDASLLADQQSIFLVHTKSDARGFCAVSSSTTSSTVASFLHECEAPNGSSNGRPGLRLLAAPQAGHFRIVNRFNGLCLTTSSDAEAAATVFTTCATTSGTTSNRQAWSFGSVTSVFHRIVKNFNSSKCLTTQGGGSSLNAVLVQKTCPADDADPNNNNLASANPFSWMVIK